jgi:deoxyribonuclease IV
MDSQRDGYLRMEDLLIGAHMSIAGGLYRALERGRQVNCRAVQIFLKNSNQWSAKPLTEQDRKLFGDNQKNFDIVSVVAHDSYLINLASPDETLYQKSIHAFTEELNRASFLGIPYLVLHPGAHMGAGVSAGISRIASALNHALEAVAPSVTVLLETTAGQGSSLGHRFEELAAIMEKIKDRNRIGVCLDTCHAFAAGYDLRTPDAYKATMDEFNRLIGIENIRVFHVNDSKKELGSRIDRHAPIGEGFIGLEAFRFLINDPRFSHIPKILETPKGTGFQEDERNLATLRSLCDVRNPG